jgi:hypothetical protein
MSKRGVFSPRKIIQAQNQHKPLTNIQLTLTETTEYSFLNLLAELEMHSLMLNTDNYTQLIVVCITNWSWN